MNTALDQTSRIVIDAVKAESARAGISGAKLARLIGRDRYYIYRRYRYEQPFSTADLSAITQALNIPMERLFESYAIGAQTGKEKPPATASGQGTQT